MAKKKKLRVVSMSPAVVSTLPPPKRTVEVTLLFEVESEILYHGPGLLTEWISGTFDNGNYDEESGFPAGLGMPMVVGVKESQEE